MSIDCPECGEDFPDDVQVGDGCDGCGAIYNPESSPDDDEEDLDPEHDVENDDG